MHHCMLSHSLVTEECTGLNKFEQDIPTFEWLSNQPPHTHPHCSKATHTPDGAGTFSSVTGSASFKQVTRQLWFHLQDSCR